MMDEREFERRTRACREKLFRICCAILPNPADREDAIQEALIKAWQRRGALRDEALFETWLVRIAINECKGALRWQRRHETAELTELIPAPEPPDPALHEALFSLDVKLRLPLTLRYVEGYTLEETARLAGVPMGTLKHRLRRAKDALRAALEKGGYEA
ncbi:MAG: RNA polymerase sigma factor [Clostridia bacterium]|nr:RNA polymerase sigma factor [Clostridia bacterium]